MMTITLHYTDNEEIVGIVTPVHPRLTTDDEFFNVIYKSFVDFHKSEEYDNGNYCIDHFIEYHNKNNTMKIEEVNNEFIQLSESNIL